MELNFQLEIIQYLKGILVNQNLDKLEKSYSNFKQNDRKSRPCVRKRKPLSLSLL